MAAELIRVTLLKDEWRPLFKTLSSRQTQKVLGDAGNELAKMVKNNLITASKWDSISRSISVERPTILRSVVKMVNYGIALDRMRPHWVSLKRGRSITKWAMKNSVFDGHRRHFTKNRSGKSYIHSGPQGGIRGGSVYVKPIPWIDKPMNKALKRTDTVVKRHVNKLLRQAKKGG